MSKDEPITFDQFLCGDEKDIQDYLIEETPLYKMYVIKINGYTFRRHIAKIDQSTGMPKYLCENRIRFNGTNPVKDAFWKIVEKDDKLDKENNETNI